jgi:hypothetical protein
MARTATKPHSVVRIGSLETDEEGHSYGETVVVVNDDGSAYYYSWRDTDWISMGMVPDTEKYNSYLPPFKKAAPTKKPAASKK